MVLLNELINILRQGQSRKMVDNVIVWSGDNPARFNLLVEVINGNSDQAIRDRAAWALSYIAESHPDLLKNHWSTFVNLLCNQHTSSPIKRNITRFMQMVSLPKKYHSLIIDRCFQLLNDPRQDIAVRVFSMTILYNLTIEYPDIENELKISIEDILPHASAGTLNRAQKILRQLNKKKDS